MKINNLLSQKEVSLSDLKSYFSKYDKIIIYGAGVYGMRLLRQIYNWGIEKEIIFAETNVLEKKAINGIMVCPIETFSECLDNFCVVIAASEQYSIEMAIKLESLKMNDYYILSEAARTYLRSYEHVQVEPILSEWKKWQKAFLKEVNEEQKKILDELKEYQKTCLSEVNSLLELHTREMYDSLEQSQKKTEKLLQQQKKDLVLSFQQQEVQLLEKICMELLTLKNRLDKIEHLIVLETADSEKLDRIQQILTGERSNE